MITGAPGILLQLEFLLRIFVACLCGGVIGYERENRNKVAGIRTHAIVSLGAALIIIVSKYGFFDVGDYDASRVAAQIVSGIGFLGAGIIFVRNNSISGLTTAAGVWATSGIGMAVGSGLYFLGVASTILMLIAQVIMHQNFFMSKEHRYETVEFVMKDGFVGVQNVLDKIKAENIEIHTVRTKRKENDEAKIEMLVILPADYDKMKLVELIAGSEGVGTIRC